MAEPRKYDPELNEIHEDDCDCEDCECEVAEVPATAEERQRLLHPGLRTDEGTSEVGAADEQGEQSQAKEDVLVVEEVDGEVRSSPLTTAAPNPRRGTTTRDSSVPSTPRSTRTPRNP